MWYKHHQHVRPLSIKIIKDGNRAVLGWISAGFGSHGFGFGDDFFTHGFWVRGPKPIRFGFPPVDIQCISKINYLELKFIFCNMLIVTCLLRLLNLF